MVNKKLEIECESKISNKCKKICLMGEQAIQKNIKRNDGKFLCRACYNFFNSRTLKNKNELFFREIDSELKAYMLGIIAGDGAVTNTTLHIVTHITDIETLELFKIFISPNSEIKISIENGQPRNCYYISIPASSLVIDVCKHLKINFGKKSDKICIPDLKEDLIPHFIRGFFDSDGSVANIIKQQASHPKCSIASVSILFKENLKNICNKNNIKYIEDKISIIFNGNNALDFLNYIYKDATVFLRRKHALYSMSKTWTSQQGSPFRPRKIRKDKGVDRLNDERYNNMYEKQRQLNNSIIRDEFGRFISKNER